jgi:cytoskeletal protein RodZ
MPPKQSTASSVPVGQRQAPTPAAQDHGTDAAAFGAFLRSQREARQLTLQQVEAVTKIAAHQFIALERGDISRWPDGMYRRAMMRAYAKAIGLDAEETVRTFVRVFSDEAADPPAEPQATAQPDPQGAAVIRRAGVLVGIVGAAAVLLLMGWYAASYVRGARQSDAVPPPQSVVAGAKEIVETASPAPPNQIANTNAPVESTSTTATSGTTDEQVIDVEAAVVAGPTEGELGVGSDPEGAQVTVNGVGWGRTPVTIKYLTMGEKRVRLTKDGYLSIEHRVQITAGQPLQTLQITLQPRTDDLEPELVGSRPE